MTTIESLLRDTLAGLHPRVVLPAQFAFTPQAIAVGDVHVALDGIRGITLLGLGKAAAAQVDVVRTLIERQFGARLELPPAFVVTKAGHGASTATRIVRESAHPTPDARSRNAAAELLSFVRRAPADHLLVVCLSGGGSALAVAPRAPFSLAEKLHVHAALLHGGATIDETNLVRREMSAFKNGGLLAATSPHRVLTLVTSDVPLDDLAVVASGPTLHESLDPDAVRRIARAHLPAALARRIDAQLHGDQRREWLEHVAAAVARHEHVVACVGDHRGLMAAAERTLRAAGYPRVHTATHPLTMSIEAGIAHHLERIGAIAHHAEPFALVTGGELPIVVRGEGRGGRNTEFVLRMAKALWLERSGAIPDAVRDDLVVCAVGSDGTDGPTDAAGGWLTRADLTRAKTLGLDVDATLDENDSLSFLEALDRAIRTGPTDTNLMDLRVIATALPAP